MLKIVISYYDNYIDRVEKIMAESPNKVGYFYVEDYIKNPEKYPISNQDVLYILNNSEYNLKLIEMVDSIGCKVFNSKFYSSKLSKLNSQQLLAENNVLVPKIIKYENLEKKDFPLFCKSHQHADMVMKVYNKLTLDNLLKKFDVNDLYFEQPVDCGDYKEYKVYFVKDDIFFDDKYNDFYDVKIKDICTKVGNVLGLDVYSTDILLSEGKYYVLDINPSAGLYMSTGSRKALLKGV